MIAAIPQDAFVVGESPPELTEKVLVEDSVRVILAGRQWLSCTKSPLVPPAGFLADLVPRHDDQELHQPGRRVQFIMPGGNSHEEAAQDRLAEVHRVEQGPERGPEPQPCLAPDRRLVFPDQLLRRLGIAPANAADQFGEIVVLGHGKRLSDGLAKRSSSPAPRPTSEKKPALSRRRRLAQSS